MFDHRRHQKFNPNHKWAPSSTHSAFRARYPYLSSSLCLMLSTPHELTHDASSLHDLKSGA